LVVISPEEARRIPEDTRRRILEYVLAKGIKPRDLGVTSSLLAKVKAGKRNVSDQLLILLCRFLSADEFRALVGCADYVIVQRGRKLSEAEKSLLAQLIIEDSELRALVRSLLKELEEKNIDEKYTYYVTKPMLEKFEKILQGRSRKTIEDRLRYLRRALASLNWTLSPSTLKEYIVKV